jgi:TolB-like protein/Flp pilus assembly protein TadD
MSEQQSRPVYEFATFRLDVTEGALFHHNKPLQLTKKEIETLYVLVQNSGHIVSRDHLMNQIWNDVCVEPANLTQTIFVLRKILARHEPDQQFIETVAKRGYRFLASTREVSVKTCPKVTAIDPRPQFESLAVLPFANATDKAFAEYLCDGLSESIINSLCQLRDVRVLARTSSFRFKARDLDTLLVGQKLGVSLVLTGRIIQLDNTIIVKAELVDVQNGWQIWGEQFHSPVSDILTLQEGIAESISSKLKAQLTKEEEGRLRKRYTDNANAYHLYLKGRYHWERFNQAAEQKAISYFMQAIESDPTYALAYAGLADSYYRLANVFAPDRDAMPKAKAAALKALEIDELLAEAHAALGMVKLAYEWDWAGAEKQFAWASQINPSYPVAHQRAGLLLNLLGRFEEAHRELRLALALDPLSPNVYWGLALSLFLARRYKESIEEIAKSLEIESGFVPTLHLLGRVYEQLDRPLDAVKAFKRALAVSNSPMLLAALGRAYALLGDRQSAEAILADLANQSKQHYVSAYNEATIQLGFGKKNLAISCLEKAYQERCEMICWLGVDPALDSIREDRRFARLLKNAGLDQHRQYLNAAS